MSVPDASFIFVGRAVSAIFGTATVYLAYRIGNRFSEWVGLFSMAILAAIPQHIEFSHMLRPEIPAIFFALLAHHFAFAILNSPKRNAYFWMGIAAGASFSVKYNIGLPLILTILVMHSVVRKDSRSSWLLLTLASFAVVFAIANPFLISEPSSLLYWVKRLDSLYVPGEDYYGQNNFLYYLEFLTRYNYNLPLIDHKSLIQGEFHFLQKRRVARVALQAAQQRITFHCGQANIPLLVGLLEPLEGFVRLAPVGVDRSTASPMLCRDSLWIAMARLLLHKS